MQFSKGSCDFGTFFGTEFCFFFMFQGVPMCNSIDINSDGFFSVFQSLLEARENERKSGGRWTWIFR